MSARPGKLHYIPEDGVVSYVNKKGKRDVKVLFLCGAKKGWGTSSGTQDCKNCLKLLKGGRK